MFGWSRRGEDLPLGAEALDEVGAVGAVAEDLDGDLLPVRLVGAHGEVDGAHAALAQLALDRVGADPAPDRRRRRRDVRGRHRRLLEEGAGRLVGGEEGLDLPPQVLVAAAAAPQMIRPLRGRQRRHLGEERLDLAPALSRHPAPRRRGGGRARPWPPASGAARWGSRRRARRRSRRGRDRRKSAGRRPSPAPGRPAASSVRASSSATRSMSRSTATSSTSSSISRRTSPPCLR